MQLLLHPTDHPIFRLSGIVAQSHIEIRINHVPVHRDPGGSAQEFDIAINEWLFQGLNHIHIHLSPGKPDIPFPPRAALTARLRHKAARDTARNHTDIGELTWHPEPVQHTHLHHAPLSPEPEIPQPPLLALPGQPEHLPWVIHPPAEQPDRSIVLTTILALPPPWPVCPWSRGSLLTAHDGTLRVITAELRKLHHTLKHGGWEDLFRHRRAAIQAAYYLGGDELGAALGFPPLLNQPAWQLQPLPTTPLTLELAAQGRLARLLDPTTGDTPLLIHDQSASLTAAIDAWWMFDNEWLLIR